MTEFKREPYINLQKSVKKILKDCGIKQKELAVKLNMNPNVLTNKLNKGVKRFDLYEILAISHELGETVEDLCSGKLLEE